jgi:hypothetical protein
VIEIGSGDITLDGKLVGAAGVLDRVDRLMKIDPLFEELRAHREAWKSSHEGEPFPGVASMTVAPSTSGRAFASVYQTIAFAGFPKIYIAFRGRNIETQAQIPSPPCGGAANPCPSGPPKHVLHVQGGGEGWRLRVPRESGPLERSGEGVRAPLEGFRSAMDAVAAEQAIGAITLHVPEDATFGAIAPFLDEAASFRQRAALPDSVTVSIRSIDTAAGNTSGVPSIRVGASSVSGRLPPELIQRVVRASFGKFRACYERAIAKNPKAGGKTETRFVIDRDGKVSAAQTSVSGLLPPEMAQCMQTVFQSLEFQPPSEGVVAVTYPIVFSPGD